MKCRDQRPQVTLIESRIFMKTTHLVRSALIAVALLITSVAFAQTAPETGPAVVTTEARNRALILTFYYKFFNNHEVNFVNSVMREDYIQHNPNLATGRQPFVDFFTPIFQQNPGFRSDIAHIGAEGDLVWVHAHQTTSPSDPGQDAIDIYRIQDGTIAEHWDSVEAVSTSPANSNGQF
jgi:predicted SnoaL-like aldol condensation-catalyzing enzyme